ncbi:MAG: cell wall hydrolase [Lachnospiraceae bacterium]|nr:cell wall hydrolase [Lachnospiraceae bacterium]
MIKRKKFWIKAVSAGLCLVLLLHTGISARAVDRSVSELEDEISEEERKEEEARAEARYYQGLYDELQKDLDQANEELDALLDEITETEERLAEAQAEVERCAQKQEENEALLKQQKETMSKRIRYMYEQQNGSIWELLTGAKSLAEVFNSADYIRSLSEYDGKMMEAYKETLAESVRLKEESEANEAAVAALLDELTLKQADMADKVQALVDKMTAFQEKIDESEAAAQTYADAVAQKKKDLEELKLAIRLAEEEAARKRAEDARKAAEAEDARKAAEAAAAAEDARKKAEEDAARAKQQAAASANSGSSGSNSGSQPSNLRWALNDKRGVGSTNIDPNAMNPTGHTNLELLASILECECGSQPYDAQVAVANVIFNRILDPRWQTTLYDVIMGKGQFTPVDNGTLAISLAKGARATCVNIARDCFNGARSLDRRWMYFCDFNDWRNNPRKYTEYKIMGAHIFYY